MVGCGLDAFIGTVHRIGVDFDRMAELAAGCFSSKTEKNEECARFYKLDPERVYSSYQEMAVREGQREDGIDFVTVAAPNCIHYQAAKAFLENGIHVFCEKPLCFEAEEAEELKKIAEERGLLFGVNYSYSGNNMVKEAREMIRGGDIGTHIQYTVAYMTGLKVRRVAAKLDYFM